MSEYALVFAVYGLVLATMLAGYLFLRRVTDGDFSVFRKTARIVVAPFHIARVAVVFTLVVIGLAFLLASTNYVIVPVTTGYQYSLVVEKSPLRYIDQACAKGTYGDLLCQFVERFTLGRAVTGVSLIESPVVTYYSRLSFRSDFVLLGLVFLIAGGILTAYFLAKANNSLYRVVREELVTA